MQLADEFQSQLRGRPYNYTIGNVNNNANKELRGKYYSYSFLLCIHNSM